ncbi:hypothetical protein CDD81_956 [Ophiocordyceps australis]|uniref:Flavin reductase like domain-containing protein n=1 Tax=Ophiocordyceps australis TaxID=1399860 RepID=A0A2C5Y0S3_9HYPO|nr:hypothetical protein CDD81_956 [Ophiocordyceps australis]
MSYCEAMRNVLLQVQQLAGRHMKAWLRNGNCSRSITSKVTQTSPAQIIALITASKTWRQRRKQVQAGTQPFSRRNRLIHASSWSRKDFHIEGPSPPTVDSDDGAPLSEQLRSTMRLIAHSVVVCTSSHGPTPRAMTMSSFTSLTLRPTPLVTFNIAVPSRTFDAIASSGAFNIHVLTGDAAGATVAERFARGNDAGAFERADGVKLGGNNISPVLDGEGVLRVLKCKVFANGPNGGLVRVRDHVVVLGEVLEMIPVNKAEGFGLTYADRKYRQMGNAIAKRE